MNEVLESLISKDVLNYYAEHELTLSDFAKAAIIWNLFPPYTGAAVTDERCDLLRQLAETTSDEGLKKQIQDRVDFERHRIYATYTIEENEYPDFKETYGKKQRFETAFLPIDFPFEKGDIVRHTFTGDIAVVESTKQKWWDLVKTAETILAHEEFTDMWIAVGVLDEYGELICSQWHPLDCEYVTQFENKETEELMKCISKLLLGEERLTNYFTLRDAYVDAMEKKEES